MTRFARAKGSKSSNERLPNEPTPWHVMKQQLESVLEKEQGSQTKAKSANQLLKEKDDEVYYSKSLGNINCDWAEFESPNNKSVKSGKVDKKPKEQIQKLKKAFEKTIEENTVKEAVNTNESTPKPGGNKKKANKVVNKLEQSSITVSENVNTENHQEKKRKFEKVDNPVVANFETPDKSNEKKFKTKPNDNDLEKTDPNESKEKKQKKKKKNKSKESTEIVNNDEKVEGNSVQKNDNVKYEKLSKRQKRNQKKLNRKNDSNSGGPGASTFNTEGNDWNNSVDTNENNFNTEGNDGNNSVNTNEKRKPNNNRPNNSRPRMDHVDWKNFRRFGDNVPKRFQKKVGKLRDDEEHRPRKPNNDAIKVTINGMDVEIVKYDGFPVKKEDAERLIELRKTMGMKGIPRKEIDAAMKLERRKCEKALARIRKQVCFHCRKAGHNLSECPELGKEEAGTGICFKCGSTEHTHFECRVTKSDDYRFAKCFICREQGHIAKQCPDNPKGLYPDGGCCKTCGDVTHLKKDCPDLVKEKEETAITLDTIRDDNLESLDDESIRVKTEVKPIKKIVKF